MLPTPLNVLLVNRHLNIGGVETYLCRLIAGLVARGHKVGLLTEGGRYESWAINSGAKLYKVASIKREGAAFAERLRSEKYDLVHGHNYHSARVGHQVASVLGVPFLMSVHGPRPRLKQLFFRQWGPEVIVMSEGDRDNVSWWGGAGSRPVSLSFYGIDTDRFHPGIDAGPLRVELQSATPKRYVAFVSRFSNRKADVGLAFLDALPSIAKRFPSVHGLLVGEGPETPRLAAEVKRTNDEFGAEIATLLGPRTDIDRVFALVDAAICTANTALESLACATPTIAAGRTGYFGRVTPDKFEAARALCFADHGHSPMPLSSGLFVNDIGAILDDITTARKIAADCASLIAANYSVAKMAEDIEQIYFRHVRQTGS